MFKVNKTFLKGVLIIAVLIFTLKIFIINCARWLMIQNHLPENADIIFIFDGDVRRVVYATTLSIEYPTSVVVCAVNDTSQILNIASARNEIDNRIWARAIVASSIDEVYCLKKIVAKYNREHSSCSILLVSSPTHMRRISFLVNTILREEKKKGANFYFAPVPLKEYGYKTDVSRWWCDSTLRNNVVSEMVKLTFMVVIDLNPLINSKNVREYVYKKIR